MDLPNVTLFFQIGNFCVAYFILRTCVFAPALKILVAEQDRTDGLNKKIEDTRSEQLQLLRQQKTRWNFIKESLSKKIPSFSLPSCSIDQTLPESLKTQDIKLSDQQKKAVQNMLQDELLDVKL
ncbi:MAG: hypothetical protein NTZ68_01015 [Candidatus Dependentiae bacterium]|nr:hypothetical protein [Candidatus Dependentiae bacterium]